MWPSNNAMVTEKLERDRWHYPRRTNRQL